MASSNYKVVIVDSLEGRYIDEPDIEREVLDSLANIKLLRVASPAGLHGLIDNADAIISWHLIPIQAELIKRLRHCRGIVRAAVGFDNIDIVAAGQHGIPICTVPDYGSEEVADHAMSLILGLVRKLHVTDRHVRDQGWDWRIVGSVMRLRGRVLGIVGLGRIGSAVARRALAFGLKVKFYDPNLPDGTDKAHGIERCETLHELISQANIITIHLPLTDDTSHLIGEEEFALMDENTVLINTARGPVIDQRAMLNSLRDGRIGGLGLDVLESEPEVPKELYESDRTLLTAHVAFYSDEGLKELRYKSALKIKQLLLGEPVRSTVDIVSAASLKAPLPKKASEHQEISL